MLDGGSTDASGGIIKRHAADLSHWASRPDRGAYAAVNEGFARSSGEIMGWLNSDDTYFPWTLRVVAEIFSAFPEVDWLMGLPTIYQRDAVRTVSALRPYPRQLLSCGLYEGRQLGWVQQESTFFRRRLWDKAGPLDESLLLAADFELWMRFARHAELHVTSTPLSGFHVRGQENRSRANIDRYFREVDEVVAGLPIRDRERRRSFLRDLNTFQRVKPFTGLRFLARRHTSVGRLVGPVLAWDFEQARYRLERRSWLD